uniref:Uncharacterized protein n=1 Tax=Solanum lycopersicum TaxID=4081 RepID=A0A3Q7EBF7_SOLLC
MGDQRSDHADQMFDERSNQIEELVHEFDLVEDNSVGLQIPLQVHLLGMLICTLQN